MTTVRAAAGWGGLVVAAVELVGGRLVSGLGFLVLSIGYFWLAWLNHRIFRASEDND